MLKKEFKPKGIHENGYIGQDCLIHEELSVGPMVAIGDRVKLGRHVVLEPGVVVGDDVEIGDETRVKANVTIGERCVIGARVLIHSGVVIGSDGYGFATDSNGCHVKRPQLGIVVVGDDVELDRAIALAQTTAGPIRFQRPHRRSLLLNTAGLRPR